MGLQPSRQFLLKVFFLKLIFYVKNRLSEIENKTSDITLEFNKIKEHASDLQTFLSLPHLISKANDEEKNVEKLGSDGKLNRKSIIFTVRMKLPLLSFNVTRSVL
jgi:hypothetical protein